MDIDANGWARGAIEALPIDEAWSLLSAEPEARIDIARWAHQARTFFRARLELVQQKRYPGGETPDADAVEVEVARVDDAAVTRVRMVTLPLHRAPSVRQAALVGVQAIGGAGFDALIARARRLWQVQARPEQGADERAPLLVAAVASSILLAPIVPPGGGTIFGVKGARTRLEQQGWSSRS
jgi:hypothetical protein